MRQVAVSTEVTWCIRIECIAPAPRPVSSRLSTNARATLANDVAMVAMAAFIGINPNAPRSVYWCYDVISWWRNSHRHVHWECFYNIASGYRLTRVIAWIYMTIWVQIVYAIVVRINDVMSYVRDICVSIWQPLAIDGWVWRGFVDVRWRNRWKQMTVEITHSCDVSSALRPDRPFVTVMVAPLLAKKYKIQIHLSLDVYHMHTGTRYTKYRYI